MSAKAQRTEFKQQRTPEALDIRVKGIRDKGHANTELIAYLSSILEIPQSHIEIISGATSSHKKIRLKCQHPDKYLLEIKKLIADKS